MSSGKIIISDIDESDVGCTFEVELDDEFIEWFMEKNNMNRWSSKKFNGWFSTILKKTLSSMTKSDIKKDKYATIYNRNASGKDRGSLDDVRVGDYVSFFRKTGGQCVREIEKVLKTGVKTVPILPGDPSINVKYLDIITLERKNY